MNQLYKGGTVYIMSSTCKRSLYTGVTSDIIKRVWQHKNGYYSGSYTSKYNCCLLVYYRHFDSITDAIAEEKRIKGGNRINKERLVESMNYEWCDLSNDFY